jgi:hypothetical protein
MAVATEKAPKSVKVKEIKKEKKPKVEKHAHPLVGSINKGSDGKQLYPFIAAPADYNPKLHKRLQAKDFSETNGRAGYFELQAAHFDKQAAACRQRAQDAKTGGSSEERKNLKKLERQAMQLLELQNIMIGKGINVDAIIARAKKMVADQAASKAAAVVA